MANHSSKMFHLTKNVFVLVLIFWKEVTFLSDQVESYEIFKANEES